MDLPELILPHPRIGQRLFVLAPLSEIGSDLIDPVTGKSAEEAYKGLAGKLSAARLKEQDVITGDW